MAASLKKIALVVVASIALANAASAAIDLNFNERAFSEIVEAPTGDPEDLEKQAPLYR